MEIKVKVKGFNTSEQIIIEKCVKETLNNHPFFQDNMPDLVRVYVKKTDTRRTGINHKLFPKNRLVKLYLGLDIWLNGLDKDQLKRVLYHEFGHFIDARLDKKFDYKDEDYEGRWHKDIYDLLWNSYIDGRLGKLAPESLEGRIKEGCCSIRLHIEIKPDYIKDAWNKKFKIHTEFLSKAKNACREYIDKNIIENKKESKKATR